MNRYQKYVPPFAFYNPYQRNNLYSNQYKKTIYNKKKPEPKTEENFKNHKLDDSFLFDLFGIKLYFDDVLILSLLFFLYKEEVKDEGLFLALVMLLIS